jgi:gluconolactonase
VWVSDGPGYLLFSDIASNIIYKWSNGTLTPYMQKAGFTGTSTADIGAEMNNGRLDVILIGSNGLTLDNQGRLIICAEGDRTMVRIEKDGTRTTFADRYEGKRLNGPNDVVVKSDGAIYFTDQNSGLRNRDNSPAKELTYHGVFMSKDNKLQLLSKDPFGADPNGLAFSPDEKYLYVNGGAAGGKKYVIRFEVKPDDTLANEKIWSDMTEDKAPGGPDGMKVDKKGNVYESGPGGIWIISPEGKHLGTILTPETVANLAFGDADGKGLYVVARRGLYKIRVNGEGIRPQPSKK